MNHKLIPQAIIVLFMMVMFKNQQAKNEETENKFYSEFIVGFSILSILLLWSWS